MTIMRAAVLRNRQFSVEERPLPIPGPGQVLVRTRACGICGSDLHLFRHGAEIAKLVTQIGVPPEDMQAGLILGHEFVAEIAAFGPDTDRRLAVGQRVLSIPFLMEGGTLVPIGVTTRTGGAYAEYLLLSERFLIPVPDGLPDEAAALTEPFAIGVHAVAKAVLKTGEVAAVIGCGPVGLAVIAALRACGVTTIVAGDLSLKRRDLARTMGATEIVNPRDAVGIVATLKALARSSPAVIFECSGAPGMLERIIRDAPEAARVIIAGICYGQDCITPMFAILKEISLQFVAYYKESEFSEALAWLASGHIAWQPLVTGSVGLAGVMSAFHALEEPERHAKIIIDPRR